jgi:LDH2 family malate/lactate/ureidoglycolate dehydrogenase
MFMPIDEFKSRVDRMIDDTKKSELAEGAKEVLLPGEYEMRNRVQNLKEGVPVLPSTLRRLREYRADAGLRTELDEIKG